ncbi:polysaccharide lyase family 1 protein [Micromonospora echinospora]|uniref:pectate lyase family protein n=1 Tax=Micromonospora echinospora TaxID=1877 RepID=UPI001E2E4B32|nr:pectate lyase [Micromonospora echinospora]
MNGRRPRRALSIGAAALIVAAIVPLAPAVGATPIPRSAAGTATPQTTGAVGTPTGFAAVSGWGQNGTTGGAGGPTVTVNTASEFLAAIARTGPLIIKVDGMIALPGPMHNVTSDKTIVGLGAHSGFTGGGLNIGLGANDDVTSPPANRVHNVIIQNLTFDDWADDAVNVQMFSHHVWIDHNTFVGGFDGAADVKRGSSFVTVSWNHSTHGKNMLAGASAENGAQDSGRLNITYHHNFFDGTVERNPWVRFGNPVHVYNNYYRNISKYGVRSTSDAGILVEGNYFQDVPVPFQLSGGGGTTGNLVSRNNCFANSGTPQTGGSVKPVPYTYQLQPCQDVPALVTAGAGAGKL